MRKIGRTCAFGFLLFCSCRSGPPRVAEEYRPPVTVGPAAESEDVDAGALVEKLRACLPDGWNVLGIETGKVRPPYWPEGNGTCVRLREEGGWPGKGGCHMQVCFMDRGSYDPPGSQGAGQSDPAAFIGESARVRVYLWGGWRKAHVDLVRELRLVPADLAGGARTDNGLQIVLLDPWTWRFEAGEPIRVTVEFRYLSDPRDLTDLLRYRGSDLTLSCTRGESTQTVTIPVSEMGQLLPMRPEGPTAQWFSVNLNKHMDLSTAGRYEIRTGQVVRQERPGRWHGDVRSNPITVVMTVPPPALVWSAPVGGLRCSLRMTGLNSGELRLRNVGQKRIAVLPASGGWARQYGGAVVAELLDSEKRVVETEAVDRAENMKRLRMLARMAQPGRPVVDLEPGELHIDTVALWTADSPPVRRSPEMHYLAKYNPKRPQWLRVRYDTRPYAEIVKSIIFKQPWTGDIVSPAVPLTPPAMSE